MLNLRSRTSTSLSPVLEDPGGALFYGHKATSCKLPLRTTKEEEDDDEPTEEEEQQRDEGFFLPLIGSGRTSVKLRPPSQLKSSQVHWTRPLKHCAPIESP